MMRVRIALPPGSAQGLTIAAMLTGIRVLDLGEEAGFLAGKILADLGADVVKVEPPGGGGGGRGGAPHPAGAPRGGAGPGRRGPYLGDVEDPERSLLWLALNSGKRGITLDLGAERGRDLYRALAQRADVILETAAPGSLEASGIDYASLVALHPRLIQCALTPFGRTGPYACYRAHDLVAVAMGGNAALTGDPERPPVRCTLPTAYFHAGPEAALGITMALFAREKTGRGQFVDVSVREAQLATLMTGPGQHAAPGGRRGRSGSRLGRTREIWKAKDGDVTFGLRGGQARIPNLVATVEYMAEEGMAPDWLRRYDWKSYNHNTLADDEIERLETAFAAFFATRSRRELYEQALERRIMMAPCNDAREILDQPQLRSRHLFTTIEYPEFGASVEHPDFFAKSDTHRIGIRRRAPRIGEHNAEIFGEIGVGRAALASLARDGVV
ncbi:MAG: CaiB/BaiF CoA transferase family protein [Myxococcota bacterium]